MPDDGADHDLRDCYFVRAEGSPRNHQVNTVHHDRVHVSEIGGVGHQGLGVGVGEHGHIE